MSCFAEQMALSKKEEKLFESENATHVAAILPVDGQLSLLDKSQIPQVDPWMYRLSVTGLVKKALRLSLNDIYEEFPKVSVTTSGHQTGYANPFFKRVEWSGIRLRHVLLASGVDAGTRFVEFAGIENLQVGNEMKKLGYSLPIKTALNPDIILAYEMNGKTLPAEQGFPLCMIAPNVSGVPVARWLREIRLLAHKIPRQSNEIKAIISTPRDGETILDHVVSFEGYAISGAGRKIDRVELSADGGRHWTDGRIQKNCNPGEWCYWESCLKLHEGTHHIYVRAWDSDANVSAALHGVRVKIVEDE